MSPFKALGGQMRQGGKSREILNGGIRFAGHAFRHALHVTGRLVRLAIERAKTFVRRFGASIHHLPSQPPGRLRSLLDRARSRSRCPRRLPSDLRLESIVPACLFRE